MKNRILPLLALTLLGAFVLSGSTCQSTSVTLAPGGVYTDPVLFSTDQAILDGRKALTDALAWYDANAAFLAKYPAVGVVAEKIRSQADTWEKAAYQARDEYAKAAKDYRAAVAAATPGSPPPDQTAALAAHAKLQGAIAVLTDVAADLAAYRAAHP